MHSKNSSYALKVVCTQKFYSNSKINQKFKYLCSFFGGIKNMEKIQETKETKLNIDPTK
jgi:hypothetical protein